jgi:hypothetical protein
VRRFTGAVLVAFLVAGCSSGDRNESVASTSLAARSSVVSTTSPPGVLASSAPPPHCPFRRLDDHSDNQLDEARDWKGEPSGSCRPGADVVAERRRLGPDSVGGGI